MLYWQPSSSVVWGLLWGHCHFRRWFYWWLNLLSIVIKNLQTASVAIHVGLAVMSFTLKQYCTMQGTGKSSDCSIDLPWLIKISWKFCTTGPWLNMKMSSYQYRKSDCGDKTTVRSSYLHNGITSTGKQHLYIESAPHQGTSPHRYPVIENKLSWAFTVMCWKLQLSYYVLQQ